MKRFGPGFLVTAAFVGPGTVTTASVAGADWGYGLAWTIVFAVAAALVLQEMAARLGLATRAGLGEAIRQQFANPFVRGLAAFLVIAAVGIGNAAYQSGNLTGAGLGLAALAGGSPGAWGVVCGVLAGLLLATGAYRYVERVLVGLVAVMAVTFVAAAVAAGPDLYALADGLLTPSLPAGAGLTAIALVGTTVVPYNLFLHSRAVCEKWPAKADTGESIRAARRDIGWSVALGGVVTLAVMMSAVPLYLAGVSVDDAGDMARQLEPVLGPVAQYLFGAGLFAAGITSAVTAPLAAAWAVAGVLGWGLDMRSTRFRVVWLIVLVSGVLFAALGTRPVEAIVLAQAANGLLLPLVAVFLIVVANRRQAMAGFRNGWLANSLGSVVVLLTAVLGIRQLVTVFG